MTAPALITLAHGSRDRRSAATIKALAEEVRRARPGLRVESAFLELSRPGFGQVVDRLVKDGYDEIVVVPLLLSDAYHANVDVPNAVTESLGSPPGTAHACHRRSSGWSLPSSRCSTPGCVTR